MESHKRTIIKTIVFRIFGVIITFAITYLLTHKVAESGEIAYYYKYCINDSILYP